MIGDLSSGDVHTVNEADSWPSLERKLWSHWLVFDLGSHFQLESVEIWNLLSKNVPERCPKDVTIWTSQDGSICIEKFV